jgi:Flp pilus assembly pilin Flp
MKKTLNKLLGNNKGQALTEYGLILVLVAVGAIATMGAFGSQIKSKVATISAALDGDSQSQLATIREKSKSFSDSAISVGKEKNTMAGPKSADFDIN